MRTTMIRRVGWRMGSAVLLLLTACGRELSEEQARDLITIRTLGLAFLEENRLEEAEAEFRKLVAMAPDEALGYANLGLVYLRAGRFDEAEQQLDEALQRDPHDPDVRLILAKVYELTQREVEARDLLVESLRRGPDHVKTLYTLAELHGVSEDPEVLRQREAYLAQAVERVPANIAVRLQLIEALLRLGNSAEATRHLEELGQQLPELPAEASEFFDRALGLARAGQAEEALPHAMSLHNVLRITNVYQAGIIDLRGPGGVLIGFPIVTFSQTVSLDVQEQEAVLAAIRFTDVTSLVELDAAAAEPEAPAEPREPGAPLAIGDYDGDGDRDLYVGSSGLLFRNDVGAFADVTREAGVAGAGPALGALFADYDNDGHLDLFVARAGANLLFRNQGDGTFREVGRATRVADPGRSYAPRFLDLDHDGDLDLYLAGAAANRLYRNNLDGTFTERAAIMGIAGDPGATSRDVAFGDFDDDGDIDLFVVNQDASNILYSNLRQGRFEDVTVAGGVQTDGGSGAVAVADYNNDGFLDLFVAGLGEGEHALYMNNGDGTFEPDRRPTAMYQSLQQVIGLDAAFFDFDNDGWQDLLVVGEPAEASGRGLLLFRNAAPGRFDDMSSRLPQDIGSGRHVAVADYGSDGDLDIFVASSDGSVRLLRNDGGDANHYIKVQLVGLRTGSGKNNHYGIGAKLEVRAGGLYQMRVVSEPVTHFGLGHRLKADVVRIVWTNGVPQNLFYPGSDQDLVEEQILKGSCPLLYAWNGRDYEFVTDIMWRSAIGMPMGIMGARRAYAPPDASQEYLRLPGEVLKPKDGMYSVQITEELWETIYLDEVELVVVDHPDSVEIYVDERFVPPGPPSLRIYQVASKRLPVSAVDDGGKDQLPALRAKDDVYVSDLRMARYQGLTEMHDLILELGDLSQADRITLFLNGWIFPTDASINVAMSQSDQIESIAPYLQVPDRDGQWQTVLQNLSFPSGKSKTVVADLTGEFLSDDYRVRIRTNMQVYWDHIFYSLGVPQSPLRQTTLQPAAADLHERGYSRLYRKGGRYGPHWFDYGDVSTEPVWLPLEGNFTRFGDVLELVVESDDKYVILAPGDELTVGFDAESVAALPEGWARDYLLYSDGWVKDADLNTAYGNTVEPLPFHRMSRYPYGADESYPTDEDHQRYLRTYNTRRLRR